MSIKLKYKGRSFSSPRSLANAMQRDMERDVERNIRRAVSGSGAKLRKTSKGFEIEGSPKNVDRFYRRLER